MDCQDVERLLSGDSPPQLFPEQQGELAAHVAQCEACQERWHADIPTQDLGEIVRLLREDATVEPRVMQAICGENPQADTGSKDGGELPRAIGGFEIISRVGQGGMGTLYKARQVSMNRIVALKVLSPQLAKDLTFVRRFVREARSAAKLSHPNIVQGIDVGFADGYHYFAMEFVDGITVHELIAKTGAPLDEREALEITLGVGRALQHAYEEGIVHRDVKPSNIIISKKGQVKLADLGLARPTQADTAVTATGTVLGSPHYVAPEQARGAKRIDTRTDIYALGATLFHMVTGAPPYDGPTPVAVAAKHITESVPSPRKRNPRLSQATSDLIQRMMAKDPNQRPATPAALIDEIRAVLGQQSTRVAPTPTGGECPTASRRALSRSLRLAIAAVAVLALLGVAVWVAMQGRYRPALPYKESPREAPVREVVSEWTSLFDGRTLHGWQVAEKAWLANHGDVRVAEGRIELGRGQPLTCIAWTGEFPTLDYELRLEAMRVSGTDCFCGIVFPIGAEHCFLGIGAWGGKTVGLEFVDGEDIHKARTACQMQFERGRWYRIRLRVTHSKVEAWVDTNRVVDQGRQGHSFTPQADWASLVPFGLGACKTAAAFRDIEVRRVGSGADRRAAIDEARK